MTFIKHCVGIDISHKTFTACICSRSTTQDLTYSEVKSFSNEKKGFNQLTRWVSKLKSDAEIVYLMEATGVYYENIAHHLVKIKKVVHVILPNKSKHYFSSLNVKTKTDEVDAKVLAQFGVERSHQIWKSPSPIYANLRNLTRYYVQLQDQKTSMGNIKHSKEEAYDVQNIIIKSNQQLIKTIDRQIDKIKHEIESLIKADKQLNEKVNKLLSIKGVGLMTVATIIAETFGFEQFSSIKQLVSYAGYDVVQRESGTSIKGKTRISKKGNRYIRNALYFPAMVSCRYNDNLKSTYLRIIQKKPSKMIGQVAIQRKLLVIMYTLWKKNQSYDPSCNQKKAASNKLETALDNS